MTFKPLPTITGSVNITARPELLAPDRRCCPERARSQAGRVHHQQHRRAGRTSASGNIVSVATNPVGGCAGWVNPSMSGVVNVTIPARSVQRGSGGAWQSVARPPIGHARTSARRKRVDFVVRIFAST